jgi:hypothetical protein
MGRDRSGDPLVRDMVAEEVKRIHRAFGELTKSIEVQFSERDPYPNFEAMVADVLANKRMLVFTGGSVTPLWDPETNWKARAVHDHDHITHMADFSAQGEIDIYRHTAARVPGLAPLYLSEIVLQAAVQTLSGVFDEQKLVIPPSQMLKKISSLGQAERTTGQPAALLVWYAATILRFSDHSGVMAHLAARGVPLEAAVAITDAAAMLFERRH